MSIKIMSEVWENSSHKSTELLTLLALADWANDDGFCWYGMSRIAERVRIEHRGLARVINKLVVSGELHRMRRYHDDKDKVKETTVSVVLTGCAPVEAARRIEAANQHLKGIKNAELPESILDALMGSGEQDTTPDVPEAITPSVLEAIRSVTEPSENPHPCIPLLERHFGFRPIGVNLELWQGQYERGGPDIFEAALIATVAEVGRKGNGRIMRWEYVRGIIDRLLAERDGNLTFNERMALLED